MGYEALVSVIVPVYNSEKYLNKCLDSIIGQTYTNTEIIVIDDGSKDNSYDMILDYQKKDNRIKSIHKENAGVSAARNDGLKIAKGKYIFFVDSDDCIRKDAISLLVSMIEENETQMVICDFQEFKNNTFIENHHSNITLPEGKITIEEYLEKMSKYSYSVYYGGLWNKLYKRDIIENNNIRFPVGIAYAEDFIFNMDYLYYVSYVEVIKEELYFYNQENENSLTKRQDAFWLWRLARKRYSKCLKLYKDFNTGSETLKNIYSAVSTELIGPTYYIIEDKNFTVRQRILNLKELYSDNLAKDAIKYTNQKNFVCRIAKILVPLNSYGVFFALMKAWNSIKRYNT